MITIRTNKDDNFTEIGFANVCKIKKIILNGSWKEVIKCWLKPIDCEDLKSLIK